MKNLVKYFSSLKLTVLGISYLFKDDKHAINSFNFFLLYILYTNYSGMI